MNTNENWEQRFDKLSSTHEEDGGWLFEDVLATNNEKVKNFIKSEIQRAKEEERERNIETVNRAYLRISPELRLDKDIKEILKNVVEETKYQIIKYIKQQ